MRKNQVDKILNDANRIQEYLNEVKDRLQSYKSINLKDYHKPVEREEAQESLAYCENDILSALLDINTLTEQMVKKIDVEAWYER